MKRILQKIALTPQAWEKLMEQLSFIFMMAWLIVTPYLAVKIYQLPFDSLQQEHVRMLFIHVPCAILSMACYTFMAGCAFIYLIWPIKPLMKIVLSLHRPTCFLVLQTLISGSLWGYPTWGTYWAWDARLTSELVLFMMLIIQRCVLQAPVRDRKKVIRFFCLCLLIGWIDIPIVHYSVSWWNTLHQGYSLSWTSGSSIDPVYLYPLLACLLNQIFWVIAVSSYLYKEQTQFVFLNRNDRSKIKTVDKKVDQSAQVL